MRALPDFAPPARFIYQKPYSFVNPDNEMKTRTKEPTIGSRHIVASATASVLLAITSANAAPVTIVQENFNGTGVVRGGS